jgi:hypothetical protein
VLADVQNIVLAERSPPVIGPMPKAGALKGILRVLLMRAFAQMGGIAAPSVVARMQNEAGGFATMGQPERYS